MTDCKDPYFSDFNKGDPILIPKLPQHKEDLRDPLLDKGMKKDEVRLT